MSQDAALTLSPSIKAPFESELRVWLAVAIAAGLGITLIQLSPLPLSGLIALIASVLVWIMLYRVASEVMLVQAQGRRDGGISASISTDGLAARHIGLWLLATLLLVAFTASFGTVGTLAGSLLLAFWLPAPTILLTLSNRMTEALLPTQWVRLIRSIGVGDYLRLSRTLLLAGLVYIGANLALTQLDVWRLLSGVISFGLWAVCVLGWFHLAGRAVFLHRTELGLDEGPDAPKKTPQGFTRDPDALWSEIMQSGGSPEMHNELIRVLERRKDDERLLEHARLHIPALLLAFEDPDSALERAARALALDADFALPDTDSMFALVKSAAQRGHLWLLVRLATNYLRAFPASVKCNDVRLLACEHLADQGLASKQQARLWYQVLMTAKLDADQQVRLKKLAPAYLNASADRA